MSVQRPLNIDPFKNKTFCNDFVEKKVTPVNKFDATLM